MTYDLAFYELESQVARESAEVVLPWLFARHPQIWSVIDVGCGTGAWATQAGLLRRAAYGVDLGVPLDLTTCIYVDHDLTGGYDCVADLAICLEVAEHLPAESAEPLVRGLAQAELVLFSAATPGQPGVGHINCQPHTYWHALFADHGMTPTYVGGEFTDPVADFYRRNMYLYQWQH